MNLKEFRTKLYGMCGLATVEKAFELYNEVEKENERLKVENERLKGENAKHRDDKLVTELEKRIDELEKALIANDNHWLNVYKENIELKSKIRKLEGK